MGTQCALVYVALCLSYLEIDLYDTIERAFTTSMSNYVKIHLSDFRLRTDDFKHKNVR